MYKVYTIYIGWKNAGASHETRSCSSKKIIFDQTRAVSAAAASDQVLLGLASTKQQPIIQVETTQNGNNKTTTMTQDSISREDLITTTILPIIEKLCDTYIA